MRKKKQLRTAIGLHDHLLYGRLEVAEILGIDPRTVDRHWRAGKFPAPRRIGVQLRWTGKQVREAGVVEVVQ